MTEEIEPPTPTSLIGPIKPDRYIHSDVWDRLVGANDDLVGIIAYGIYQQRKRTWLESCKSRDNCFPAEQIVKEYSFSYRADAIAALRKEAEGYLYNFGEQYSQSQLADLQATAFNQRTIEEIGQFKRQYEYLTHLVGERTGYTHHIKTHIAGFLIIAGIIALVSIAANFDDGPKQVVSGIWKFLSGIGK